MLPRASRETINPVSPSRAYCMDATSLFALQLEHRTSRRDNPESSVGWTVLCISRVEPSGSQAYAFRRKTKTGRPSLRTATDGQGRETAMLPVFRLADSRSPDPRKPGRARRYGSDTVTQYPATPQL